MLLKAIQSQIISEGLRIILPNHIRLLNKWAILRASRFGRDIYNTSPVYDEYLIEHLEPEQFTAMKNYINENIDIDIGPCSFSIKLANGWIYVSINIQDRKIRLAKYINNWSRGNIVYSKVKSIKNRSEHFIVMALLQYNYMFYEVYEYIPMSILHDIITGYGINVQGFSSPLLSFTDAVDFCSFIDTDHIFGSIGSIFDTPLYFKDGNKWIIRPPDIPILITEITNKIIVDMDTASFNNLNVAVIYVIPKDEDIKSEYIKKTISLRKNKHLIEIDSGIYNAKSDYTMYILDNYRIAVDYSGIENRLLIT